MGNLNPANFPLQRPAKQKQKNTHADGNQNYFLSFIITDVGHKTRKLKRTAFVTGVFDCDQQQHAFFSELPTNRADGLGREGLVTEPTTLPSDTLQDYQGIPSLGTHFWYLADKKQRR
jgi:hypothetical protein